MKYKFWKFQGTGNDFIFFDGRQDVSVVKDNKPLIARLCDRRFGIGADGLIILEEKEGMDFKMVYYNSDGGESTMCGNGGRCSIAFAKFRGFSTNKTDFEAIDGMHEGYINENGTVELGMTDVRNVAKVSDQVYLLNTGSPHFVRVLSEGENIDIVEYGRSIRYSDRYREDGINVNTIAVTSEGIKVETYERGVEDETYSCGTGVTACAIVYNEIMKQKGRQSVKVETKGGKLEVHFTKQGNIYENIVLEGPAKMVFEGEVDLERI